MPELSESSIIAAGEWLAAELEDCTDTESARVALRNWYDTIAPSTKELTRSDHNTYPDDVPVFLREQAS